MGDIIPPFYFKNVLDLCFIICEKLVINWRITMTMTASNPNPALYTAPFDDPNGDHALYVPLTGGSMVKDDPRIKILMQHGFKHAATHGFCAAMFPADIAKAKAILAANNLPI